MARRDPRDTERPRKRNHVASLTEAQRRRLRVALKNLRKAHGSWLRLATAMGVSINTLWGVSRGNDFGSMFLALRVAEFARLPITYLLGGKPIAADRCPACGQPIPDR